MHYASCIMAGVMRRRVDSRFEKLMLVQSLTSRALTGSDGHSSVVVGFALKQRRKQVVSCDRKQAYSSSLPTLNWAKVLCRSTA